MRDNYLFLTIGKTKESSETQEFKRYIGIASSYVLAVNPKKEKLDELTGFDNKEPEYIKDGDDGKEVHIHFIVKTDPEASNGIELVTRLMFVLKGVPAYNRDKTKAQVIDNFGNTTWVPIEDAKAGKKLLNPDGTPKKIGDTYRIAAQGEADLVAFLKKYLCVGDAFKYENGVWSEKENADEFVFGLEHIKDYFKGDFSELREALALQPNNKVKLLYGVRTADDGKQYQAVASKGDLIMGNNAGSKAYDKVETRLNELKAQGSYPTTEFKIQPLAEYTVEATNLSTPKEAEDDEMPWSV